MRTLISRTAAYATWIETYRTRVESTYGRCAEATAEMVEAFPELVRTPGHVECPDPWGRRGPAYHGRRSPGINRRSGSP